MPLCAFVPGHARVHPSVSLCPTLRACVPLCPPVRPCVPLCASASPAVAPAM